MVVPARPGALMARRQLSRMATFVQEWQGKVAWPLENDSYSRMEEYWSGLVSCAVVAGACAPRATVAGGPGAVREGVERVEAFRNIGIPCPGQDRANFPYQLSAPDSVEAVAGVFLFPVAVAGTVGRVVVVVVVGEEDTPKAVAQPVVAAPLCLVVPARIASRSSPVALLVSVLVVAGVVVVLRFPLCLLYRSMFNQCLSGFLFAVFL